MIKVTMSLSHDGLADGIYHIHAKRFLMATLFWANEIFNQEKPDTFWNEV